MQELINTGKIQLMKIFPVDTALFLLQFFKHPKDIGAVTPSSKALAESMTRFVVSETDRPKHYLEVGAGTGAFTETLVKKMGMNDTLDIVEINEEFCQRLKKKYSDCQYITIYNGSILDWKPEYKYDSIVSSLPFNAFRSDFVTEIFAQYKNISKEGTMISYFEYMALPRIRKLLTLPKSRRILQETLDTTSLFEIKHEMRIDKVFANFPPAFVHHCKI